jgi:hypothetical protein
VTMAMRPDRSAVTDVQARLDDLMRSFPWPDGVLDALRRADAALDAAYLILDEGA